MTPWRTLSLAAILAATPALAQQAATPAAPVGDLLVEIDRDDVMVTKFGISVEELESMRLFGANGEEIGEIEDVLGDAAGMPAAVTVEVGGFLGMGEREVILQLDAITVAGLRLTLDATREQIEALPEWDD
jgi:hypothetical protein